MRQGFGGVKAKRMLLLPREEDGIKIHRAVQDVQYLHCFGGDAVEDQIVAMNAAADAGSSMTLQERISLRHGPQFQAIGTQFPDECCSAKRAVERDVIAYGFDICLSLMGEDQPLHLVFSAIA